MNQVLITPSQEPKETQGTQVYREHLDWTGGKLRVVSLETRVQKEEEGHSVRRVHLDSLGIQDSKVVQVLQVHRVPEGPEVSLDREESMAFLDVRVDLEKMETREQTDAMALTDRRANQESQV